MPEDKDVSLKARYVVDPLLTFAIEGWGTTTPKFDMPVDATVCDNVTEWNATFTTLLDKYTVFEGGCNIGGQGLTENIALGILAKGGGEWAFIVFANNPGGDIVWSGQKAGEETPVGVYTANPGNFDPRATIEIVQIAP